MKKATWIFLALLLNLGLIVFFFYFYRDFQTSEKIEKPIPIQQPALEEVQEKKEEVPPGPPDKFNDMSGPRPPMAAQAPTGTASSEKAFAAPQTAHQAVVSKKTAKPISHFPLFVGMTLLVSLLLNFALLLLYKSYASQALVAKKRQDFVSAVTHELRTPLTSIKMFGELLEDGMASTEEKKKEYYGLINKESGRLSRLIDNILQLSSLEKKNYHPQLVTEPLQTELLTFTPRLKMLAEKSGFTLELNLEDSLQPVTFDREAIHQILFIFLENSLKFSALSENKTLNLSLCLQNNRVILSWQDHGPGVPEGELSKIFEPFYRVENELTRKTKGTGIGLAVAKMLVDSMRLRIKAENLSPGFLLQIIF
ncbi:MAG: HAMP domain-containing histidine kinase [Deltaproteobacteria bacterium]|nr:MAG: HAMP domain-containing histidine kinase [Deltaproteobacteria bacterium]